MSSFLEVNTTGSAPGKAILFGEHAVVHGARAVAAALSDLRLKVELRFQRSENVKGTFSVEFADILDENNKPTVGSVDFVTLKEILGHHFGCVVAEKPSAEITEKLFSLFSHLTSHASQGMGVLSFFIAAIAGKHISEHVDVYARAWSCGLPLGAGLGSSAALTTAAAAAVLKLNAELNAIAEDKENPSETTVDLNVVNEWALVGEMFLHGQPSGLDNTTSCFGGLLRFERTPTGTEYASIPSSIPLNMLLVNTLVPRVTKQLVAGVGARLASMPKVVQPIFNSIAEISNTFLEMVPNYTNETRDETMNTMSTLISMNHHLLNSLGVGHPTLDKIVSLADSYGFPAKLTGAGGGGCAIVLLETPQLLEKEEKSRRIAALSADLRSAGFDVFESSIGGQGVQWV